MKAALYLRVSTDRQTVENQRSDLLRLAERRGLTVTVTYEETESGAKRRPVLERALAEAGKTYDVLLVWALDRLGRGGALEALTMLQGLERNRVGVLSYQEPWLDTSTENPFREVLISFAATLAKMERTRLIERTKAGLARARREGKRIGRPPCSPVLLNAAADRVAQGASIRGAARELGVPERSVRRLLFSRQSQS